MSGEVDSKRRPGELGTEEHARRAQAAFVSHVNLLYRLVGESEAYREACKAPRLGSIQFVIASLLTSTHCIADMEFVYLNEGFMLCRSIIERAVTSLYLLFCEEDEFQRYLTYTKQKAYRITEQVLFAGDLAVGWRRSPSLDLENDDELKRAVAAFTSKRGKAIPRWRSRSLQDMLDYLGKNTSVMLAAVGMAFLFVYDDASEALHGTLYGSLFHYEVYSGRMPHTPEDMKASWFTQWSILYLCCCGCISAVIEGIGQVASIAEVVRESKAALETMLSEGVSNDRDSVSHGEHGA